MSNVSSVLSGVMSMGIVAGFVSGLYYLVVAGIRWAGKLVTSLGEQGEKCDCCGDTLTNPSNRKCSVCARHREVKLQSGEWFYRQLQSRFNRSAITNSNYSVAHKDGAGMDPESAQVREFIERLVEALVSGQLDDVKVNRLYTHPEYKPVPDDETPSAVHAALKQQIQSILQEAMALPNLQNKVSNENRNAVHHWDEDITTKTYEDILSTAILNKVIQQFQQRNRNSTRFTETTFEDTMDSNKNILHNSDMEEQKMPKFISTVEIGVNSSGNLTGTNMSTTGDRSWITSSSDNPMSMTIEECIEEVTTYDSVGEEEEEEESNEDLTTSAGSELDFYLSGLNFIKQRRVPFPEFGMDIIDGSKEVNNDNEAKAEQQSDSSESPHPTDLVTPIDSWEENWLFQRRRLKAGTMTGNSQGMPVPMLVPNPSEDFRALIGDRDAEEVSDLSDCSDAALEDIVLADVEPEKKATTLVQDAEQHNSCARENDLHESIAAKAFSRIEAINPDNSREQLSNDITGSQEEHCSMDSDKNIFGSTTDEMEASSLELNKASSVECLSEFGQQDSEYTEDYASVTQRQLNSLIRLRESDVSPTPLPVPKPRNQQKQTQLENTADENQQNQRQSEETSDIHIDESDPLESSPPKPGTIAEREHRKWESAPPLPNNPYSPENISKRLSRKSLYSISSASSRSSSVDFPELNGESVVSNTVAEPLHVICTSGDPDYKRYGRDYYINQSKSASGERKSHSRLSSPSSLALQHQYHQVCESDNSQPPISSFERDVLHRNIYRKSYRACNQSSPNFTVNPLFEGKIESCAQEDDHDQEQGSLSFEDSLEENTEKKCYNERAKCEGGIMEEAKKLLTQDGVKVNPLFDANLEKGEWEKGHMKVDRATTDVCNTTLITNNQNIGELAVIQGNKENIGKDLLSRRGLLSQESGYSNSLDSLAESNLANFRLIPPSEPQMVERSFESLACIHRSASLKLAEERRRKVLKSMQMGGSLRTRKSKTNEVFLPPPLW